MSDLLKGINVFLIGMMGAGKTTVGKLLESHLNYRFVDTDDIIERSSQQFAGKTIRQIFAEEGEESFRQLESKVLAEVAAYTRLIVATGGGIILRPMNWSYLHQGLVVWLDAPVEVLIERLRTDQTRPLLQTSDPALTLQKLFDQRRNLYAQADLHIPVTAKDTPEEISLQVMAKIPSVLKSSSV